MSGMCVNGVMEKNTFAIQKTSDQLQNFHPYVKRTLNFTRK